jgi:hypothetical protein
MPFTYRGPGPWGAGAGARLTQAQFDGNTYEAQTRIEALEAAIAAFGGVIENITLAGTTLTFHLVGGAEHQITLPVPRPNRVEAWQPNTFYVPWDFVSHNGSVYIVLYAHESAAVFDPGANNGAGQDYYGLFFTEPALMIPEGGQTGQVLTKASDDDFATIWQTPTVAALDDVELNNLQDGDLLKWDASEQTWVNGPVAFSEIAGQLSSLQFPAALTALDTSGDVTINVFAGTVFTITPTDNVTLSVNSFPAGMPLVLLVGAPLNSYTIAFDADSFVGQGALAADAGTRFALLFWCDGSRFMEVSRLGPIGD